jgi:hypothetical protein
VQPFVQLWETAENQQFHDPGPHTEASFRSYLQWYQPRTRCRLTYVDLAPEPHHASSQEGYARYRDEALAGMVSATTNSLFPVKIVVSHF